MQELQQEWVPVHKHFRLNERNYGALVGMNKKECVEKHGAEVKCTMFAAKLRLKEDYTFFPNSK